jgi:4-alpha-glucanotransferase
VPADYFSPMGQRWANPMHDWQAHARGKYRWWKARMRRELDLVDAVRLDHFRGFCAAWAIPADEPDARKGAWVEGPGAKLFAALRKDLGSLPCWAEDLGEITPDVEGLRDGLDLPGMKILQFAFGGGGEHPFLPHNYAGTRWVAYTGTHDNDTAVGWYATADEESRHRFRVYTGRDGSDPAWSLIRESFASVAETAIAPLQDFLRLGSEARMNTPGTVEGNWSWRAREIPWDACGWIRGMVEATGRG